MLLPSALACDQHAMSTRSSRRLFSRPPLSDSDPISALDGHNPGLYDTCKALQSILTTTQSARSAPASKRATRLQPAPSLPNPVSITLRSTPTHAPSKVQKYALRTMPSSNATAAAAAKKRPKLAAVDDVTEPAPFEDTCDAQSDTENRYYLRCSTPKRQRLAPLSLPLGLERSDFEALKPLSDAEQNNQQQQQQQQFDQTDQQPLAADEWSTEEDRVLVEMVLDKMKLTKGDWVDCAKTLGKDRGSIGKRWKSLVGDGSVGLRRSARRAGGRSRPSVNGLFGRSI